MTDTDKKLIISFVASSMFDALKRLVDVRIQEIKSENPKKENEFETIYQLGFRSGREAELVELLKTLELISQRN